MKKILGIIILNILLLNVSFAFEFKPRSVLENLRCYETNFWVNNLDFDKENNAYGNVLNVDPYDGQKKPPLTLVITAEEVEDIQWKGEVLLINRWGKEKYKITSIDLKKKTLDELHAGLIKSNGDTHGIYLKKKTTFESKYDDDDTKEDIYFDLVLTYFSDISVLKSKKDIFMQGSGGFSSFASRLVCIR